jgi:enamine deaminase RidA (YjgF/YER057c/UK114 family)
MERRNLASRQAPAAAGGYAQAVEVSGTERILFISGQVPLDLAGNCPASFADQCRQAWSNLEAQLRAADMSFDNLVKVTIFLSDRRHAAENRDIRQAVLSARTPALTVIITGIFDETWLLEIEAIAAA